MAGPAQKPFVYNAPVLSTFHRVARDSIDMPVH